MPEQKSVNVSVNIGALLGNYLAKIQNLLDVTTFAYAGLESVTEEQYQSPLSFISVHPAMNRKHSLLEAKDHTRLWLPTSFLKDSVEATGGFLEECWKVCACFRLSGSTMTSGNELKNIFEEGWESFNKLTFPNKFKKLKDEFGIETCLKDHFLSLNKARNCLVHRGGLVSDLDKNVGDTLLVKWRIMRIVATSPDGKVEIPCDHSTMVEGGWSIAVRFQDKHRSFKLGDQITFDPIELSQSALTLKVFAEELVKSVEAYGVSQGLPMKSGTQEGTPPEKKPQAPPV